MVSKTPEGFLSDFLLRLDLLERRLIRKNQPGALLMYAGNREYAPSGTVWADGSILQVEDFPRLFEEFGTEFGGDGVTTFGIPNMTGVEPAVVRYAIYY